jgi:hypothetical protein
MARRCLYYPFIHVRDEAWLKLSALYWDDMTRIVPKSYTPRDTRDVRALEDAGVLKRIDPAKYEEPVGELFRLLLERHAHKLAARYDVSQRDGWPENRERFGLTTGRTSPSSLAFIHGSKLEPALTEQLLKRKLALPSRDRRWLGMHPAIVRAYMIALAAEIANRRGLQPVSDNVTHLSGVASCTVDDLARSLFGDLNLSKKRALRGAGVGVGVKALDVTEERVAFVTLRAVLPERLDAVPVKRILELRHEHADARHAFHSYVEDVREQLATGSIVDAEALDEHIRLEYDKRLKPALSELSRGLRSLGVGTFLGTFGVAVALPVGSMLSVSPSAAVALAGAGVGIAALSQRQQGTARALVKASPASFLLVTERLRPRTLVQRLTHGLRRFSLGV